jgi:amino acid adenylation domain-containing protein
MTPSSIDLPTTLSRLLDRPASGHAEIEALFDGSERLTWAEYRTAAAGLAGALAEEGVRPGDRVAVHLPKSVASFVAMHAVLRLGAVAVPIDAFAPRAHTRRVIGDADVAALIGDPSDEVLVDGLAPHRIPVVAPHRRGRAVPAHDGAPDDAAYIIFTSGSTGRPKGIVHSHRSALAYASCAADTYGLRPSDRLANVAPLHFDQSTFELYAAPLVGAGVLVLPDAVLRFPASVASLLASERITVWYSVPFAITQLVERGALDRHDLTALRWVLFGGESFPPAAARRAMTALASARFSNVYGPAEVNQCTFHHLDSPPPDAGVIPIGTPWPVATVELIDDTGAAVVGDGQGELLVATDTMMTGYWNQPDLTAAAIVERPDHPAGRRWYRTGDLVRRRQGVLEFIGRADHQVKVRGHRVELEPIEALIVEHPAVDSCVVIVARADGTSDRAGDELVALVCPAPSEETRSELRAQLRCSLPAISVPTRLVGVDSVPRSRTGKVDRCTAADQFTRAAGASEGARGVGR